MKEKSLAYLYKRKTDGKYELGLVNNETGNSLSLFLKLSKKRCEELGVDPNVEFQYIREEQTNTLLEWITESAGTTEDEYKAIMELTGV